MRQLVAAMVAVLALTHSAQAQGRVFVSGDAFADIKRFSGDASTLALNGTAAGGGARIGMFVASRVSVEFGLDVGTWTTKTSSRPITILGRAPTIVSFRSRTRNRLLAGSVLLGYRPSTGRVHPEFLGGLTFVHVVRKFETTGPTPLTPVVTTVPTIITQILVPRPQEQVDNVPAATVGFNLALDLTRHLALVPEVRAHLFSLDNSGPSAFVVRPGLAVRWTF